MKSKYLIHGIVNNVTFIEYDIQRWFEIILEHSEMGKRNFCTEKLSSMRNVNQEAKVLQHFFLLESI